MDPQYLEDLAGLAFKYREARQAFRKISIGCDLDVADAAHAAVVTAANKLLAFAAEEPS